MGDLLPITLEDEITELKRELRWRESVFTNMVAAGRLKQHQKDWRIACMTATLKRLEALRDG